MNRKVILVIIAIFVAAASLFVYNQFLGPVTQKGAKEITIEIFSEEQGIDKSYTVNTDAEFLYDLLGEVKEKAKVEFLDSSFGPMLVGLEGYTAQDAKQEFWLIKINGEDAMVGVKDVPVISDDVYRFELSNW